MSVCTLRWALRQGPTKHPGWLWMILNQHRNLANAEYADCLCRGDRLAIVRPRTNGPRLLMRITTHASRHTFTRLPNGKVRCAAVKLPHVLLVSAQILAGYALARDSALIAQIAKDVGIELYRYLISAWLHSFHKRSVGDLLTPLSCDVEHIEHRRSQDPPRSRSRVGLQQ